MRNLLAIAEQRNDPRDIVYFACITRTTYSTLQDLVYQSCARQSTCTALHYAAKYNNHDAARSLLGDGANINSTLKSSTALLVAAAFWSETVVDLFLAREDMVVNARNMHGKWRSRGDCRDSRDHERGYRRRQSLKAQGNVAIWRESVTFHSLGQSVKHGSK